MRLRTTLLGSGTPADPLRYRFPTAVHFQRDPINMTIIIDVPDDDLPPAILNQLQAQAQMTPDGPILTTLQPGQLAAIIARLKARYPGAPGLDNVDVR